MKFYEVAKELSKLLEEDNILSKDEFIAIANKAYNDNLHVYPEDLDNFEVTTIRIGGEPVQILGNQYPPGICSLDTFKQIISNYVGDLKATLPDGVDDFLDRNGLEEAALSDKYIFKQLDNIADGGIKDYEEVDGYIVMEIM